MTAAQLSPVLRRLAFALMLVGLLVSEFLDLRRMGIVLASGGIASLGAWVCAAYIRWEVGDD